MFDLDWNYILSCAQDVTSGLLMVLGGLAIIARYTRWAMDKKLLSALEQIFKIAAMLIPVLLAMFPKKKKKKGKHGNKNNTQN